MILITVKNVMQIYIRDLSRSNFKFDPKIENYKFKFLKYRNEGRNDFYICVRSIYYSDLFLNNFQLIW